MAARLEVMNFLNEVAGDYPSAISFASGRPAEQFFSLAEWLATVPDFIRHFSVRRGIDSVRASDLLAQYGSTNGIMNELIARQIGNDEQMFCSPGQIVVTAGCQEAISLCVRTFCPHPGDVILVRSPAYIGLAGAAITNRVQQVAFSCPDVADMLAALKGAVSEAIGAGKRPRLLYLVPDFDNPTATVIPRTVRQQLIDYCASEHIVILEDNPYGMFRFAGERVPTMFSLDTRGCVVYLGTYSKTICPALRIGFAVIPEALFGSAEQARGVIAKLSQDKSFSTVNTSQMTQAIAGGMLLSHDCTLQRHVAPALAFYRDNYDEMRRCLETSFQHQRELVSWNAPEGGFFMIVSVPFQVRQAEAQECARDYGALMMPLSFFAYDDACDYQVRLAFSNVAKADIADGIARFARFVSDRIARAST